MIGHINIRSLPSASDLLAVLLTDMPFHILATRMDDSVSSEEVIPNGYTFYCKVRHRLGGGVGILVSSHINCRIKEGISQDDD